MTSMVTKVFDKLTIQTMISLLVVSMDLNMQQYIENNLLTTCELLAQ